MATIEVHVFPEVLLDDVTLPEFRTVTSGKVQALSKKYMLSVCAATAAELFTYPIDIVKTRLQVQSEMMHRGQLQGPAKSLFGLTWDLIRLEGTTKLWRGLTPTTYRHLIYTGSRMTIYETLRDLYANPETKQMDAQQLLFRTIGLGIFAGALGQFMASPVDLVKVRMQLDGQLIARGLPPRVLSVSSALIQTVREGGIRSLWKGGAPNVARASLVNLGDLTAYDRSKKTIMEHTSLGDTYWTHSIASGCAGLVSAVLATPADVIRTRVMNQPTDSHGRGTLYSSSTDCLVKTVKYEGVPALYRGFFPLWARLAPWSFIFWVSYEKLRGAAGLESF